MYCYPGARERGVQCEVTQKPSELSVTTLNGGRHICRSLKWSQCATRWWHSGSSAMKVKYWISTFTHSSHSECHIFYNNDDNSSKLVWPSHCGMFCFLSTNQNFFRHQSYSRLKYCRPQLALTSQGLSLSPWQHLQLEMCSSLVAKLQISEQVFLVADESAPWLMILFVMRSWLLSRLISSVSINV